jgi:hypothetical protein
MTAAKASPHTLNITGLKVAGKVRKWTAYAGARMAVNHGRFEIEELRSAAECTWISSF